MLFYQVRNPTLYADIYWSISPLKSCHLCNISNKECTLYPLISLVIIPWTRYQVNFSTIPVQITGSWRDFEGFPENFLKGCKWYASTFKTCFAVISFYHIYIKFLLYRALLKTTLGTGKVSFCVAFKKNPSSQFIFCH
jgi:hypothetical protein